jgi:hypothetical protein
MLTYVVTISVPIISGISCSFIGANIGSRLTYIPGASPDGFNISGLPGTIVGIGIGAFTAGLISTPLTQYINSLLEE